MGILWFLQKSRKAPDHRLITNRPGRPAQRGRTGRRQGDGLQAANAPGRGEKGQGPTTRSGAEYHLQTAQLKGPADRQGGRALLRAHQRGGERRGRPTGGCPCPRAGTRSADPGPGTAATGDQREPPLPPFESKRFRIPGKGGTQPGAGKGGARGGKGHPPKRARRSWLTAEQKQRRPPRGRPRAAGRRRLAARPPKGSLGGSTRQRAGVRPEQAARGVSCGAMTRRADGGGRFSCPYSPLLASVSASSVMPGHFFPSGL